MSNTQSQFIFIPIASYLDPLLFFTLNSAYKNAKYPKNLVFGVVDQNFTNQREEIKKLPFADQIRYCHLFPEDTLGVSWARSIAYSLYNGEDYLLQVDSHTYFEDGWDEKLINQLNELKTISKKPILSTYPYDFRLQENTPIYKESGNQTVLVLKPHPDESITVDNPIARFRANHVFSEKSVLGSHLAGGFIFCDASFIEEVPYDPYMYFHGEEQNLSLRAFTRGWDIYHPKYIPLYHHYKEANVAHDTHHWHGDVKEKRDFDSVSLRLRAQDRLVKLIRGDLDEGVYGLGKVRNLNDFRILSGIDYINGGIDENL